MGEDYEAELAEEEPGWDGPSQEDWQSVVGFQQQVAPFLSELAGALQTEQGQQQPQGPEYDPWDEDSVRNYIGSNIQQGINQALEPYAGILGLVASQEGEKLAHSELDKIKEEVGDFDRDTAFLIASGLIDQGHDPAAALRRAAEFSKEVESRIRADERKKYEGDVARVAGSRGDVPTNGQPAEISRTPPGGGGQEKYLEAVQRAIANRHPSMPIG
jgi:hypothetical protein